MEQEILYTYSRAWKLERMLYRLENWTLPFPISFEQIWVFLASVGCVALLRLMPGIGSVVRYKSFFWWCIVPTGMTWFLTRTAVDGKNPLVYVRSRVRHWLSPKRMHRYREYRLRSWQVWFKCYYVRVEHRQRKRALTP